MINVRFHCSWRFLLLAVLVALIYNVDSINVAVATYMGHFDTGVGVGQPTYYQKG